MILLMSCFMTKKNRCSQVSESEIIKTVTDGRVQVEVVLRPKYAKMGEPISLDIYIHTVRGIDINTPVVNSIGELIILERSYSGGGNSDGEFYSGRHFELEAPQLGWYRIPSFDIYYTDTTKKNSEVSGHISTNSFTYVIRK